MVFENAKTWFFWFVRKLRNDPSDVIFPLFLLSMFVLLGWVAIGATIQEKNSQRTQCTEVSVKIYVDPDTKEESPVGELRCMKWVSPVTGKLTIRKEK